MDLENESCAKMYQFYQEEKLCDLVLISEQDGTRIVTHRLIVSAASQYFETLLTSTKDKDKKEISLGKVSGPMLKDLIEYSYTGQFAINAENVNDVLAVTAKLRFVRLAAQCVDYLKSNVVIESRLAIWSTAKLFELHDVANSSFNYICEYFSTVVKTDAFRQLKSEYLIELLDSNELAVESEEEVFNTVFKWIEFDVENRRGEFEKLLATIRLSQISCTYLTDHVLKCLNKIGLGDLFSKVCEYATKSKEDSSNEKPRKCLNKCIYAISTKKEEKVVTIQRYNQILNSWEIAHTLNRNLAEFGVVCNNNDLFLIGGWENTVQSNKVLCLPLNSLDWTTREIAPMKYEAFAVAAAKLLGFIYVTGGYIQGKTSTNVERLELDTLKWSEVPSMNLQSARHSIAVLSGKLFVAGGWDGRNALNTTECYDPQLNKWTTLSSMNIARQGHRLVVVENVLYAIGGYDYVDFNSIEKYDEVADKWLLIKTELPINGRYLGSLTSNNWIYIGGGMSGKKDFEKLNIETGDSLILPSLLQNGRMDFVLPI